MFRGVAVILLFCAGLLTVGCGDDSSGADLASISTSKAAEERGEPKVRPIEGPPPKQLEINDLIDGTGAEAKPGDELTINYFSVEYGADVGFDSSWARNQTVPFTLGEGEVFRGWEIGLEGMKVGGRRELIVPPELHYGKGQFGHGDPNATIVFVIDLLEVVS